MTIYLNEQLALLWRDLDAFAHIETLRGDVLRNINRDCYICHFPLNIAAGRDRVDPQDLHLHVIDLHRAQIRDRVPLRWIVKDLAGLYFPAMHIGLTRTDCLRFMATCEQKPLREILRERRRFWRRVARTAGALKTKLSARQPRKR